MVDDPLFFVVSDTCLELNTTTTPRRETRMSGKSLLQFLSNKLSFNKADSSKNGRRRVLGRRMTIELLEKREYLAADVGVMRVEAPAFGVDGASDELRLAADVNGDGFDDIIAFNEDGVTARITKPSLDNGPTFNDPTLVTTEFFSGKWNNTDHIRMMADVNNDGKEDIVGFWDNGVHVSLSASSETQADFLLPVLVTSGFRSEIWNNTDHIRMMADVNNDGKDDIIGFGGDGVHVSLSASTDTQAIFRAPTLVTTGFRGQVWNNTDHIRTMADVNGDGREDIVGFGEDAIYVSLSNSSVDFLGFQGQAEFQEPRVFRNDDFTVNQGWKGDEHPRMMVDVNIDGMSDIVGFGSDGVWVALSRGGSFSPKTLWVNDFVGDAWMGKTRVLHDMNGDGAADIVGFKGDAVYVGMSGALKNDFKFFTKPSPWLSKTLSAANATKLVGTFNGDLLTKYGSVVEFDSTGFTLGVDLIRNQDHGYFTFLEWRNLETKIHNQQVLKDFLPLTVSVGYGGQAALIASVSLIGGIVSSYHPCGQGGEVQRSTYGSVAGGVGLSIGLTVLRVETTIFGGLSDFTGFSVSEGVAYGIGINNVSIPKDGMLTSVGFVFLTGASTTGPLVKGYEYSLGHTWVDDPIDGGCSAGTRTAHVVPAETSLVDGTLYVIGTDGQDRLKLNDRNDQLEVDGWLNQDGGDVTSPRREYIKKTYAISSVDRVVAVLGDGNNFYYGRIGDAIPQVVSSGDGNDAIYTGAGADEIDAGNGRNRVWSGNGDNLVTAGDGDDLIWSGNGKDTIDAGEGRNRIWAGEGNDTVWSGSGDDWIFASGGNNFIPAGDGRNTVRTGDGRDTVITGSGIDWISTAGGIDAITAGGGNNRVQAGDGADIIVTGAGRDWIDAGEGDDFVRAGDGNDMVFGGQGNDILLGEGGNDSLYAGSGRNLLIGGTGRDRLVGGAGENILIGDSTTHDLDDFALLAILAEWSADKPVEVRRQNLIDGSGDGLGLNGSTLLNLAAILDDLEHDLLHGGGWKIEL